jgi:N-methylhydantoinase A
VVEQGRQGPSRNPGTRQVCFDASQGYVDTAVLWRPDLAPGATVDGPAVIEEFGSTVPLHPGFSARVDDFLNLIVTRPPVVEERAQRASRNPGTEAGQ